MANDVYHTFMPNGEFWVAPRSIKKLREVGTIVFDPDHSGKTAHLWDGKRWISFPMEDLPALIKTFLLIYSVSESIKARIRNDRKIEPIYLCNWR